MDAGVDETAGEVGEGVRRGLRVRRACGARDRVSDGGAWQDRARGGARYLNPLTQRSRTTLSHSVRALMSAPTNRMYADTNVSSVTAHGTARIVSTSGACDWSSLETTAVSASSQARSCVSGVAVRGCEDDVEAF